MSDARSSLGRSPGPVLGRNCLRLLLPVMVVVLSTLWLDGAFRLQNGAAMTAEATAWYGGCFLPDSHPSYHGMGQDGKKI